MNETAAPMLYRNSGSTGWLHNYQNQELYTFERHFIYEFAKTSLYEWQKQLGMLSPYAEVYYLLTDKSAREQNTNETETSTQGKDYDEKEKITIDTNKEDIRININTIPKPNEWKKVRAKKTKRAETTKSESPNEKDKLEEYNNQYSSLDEGNDIVKVEETMDKDDSKGDEEDVGRGYVKEECEKYNIDKVSMEVLEREIEKHTANTQALDGKHEEMEELNCNDVSIKIKAMQEEIETLQYQHLVNLQSLEEYEEIEETLRKKLHEVEIGQNEVIAKDKEINELKNKIKRFGETKTCQEEKEEGWMKCMKEYEDKLTMVDLVLADYDMILKWEEGGVKVYNTICDEEDEMYKSDDSSCEELIEEA